MESRYALFALYALGAAVLTAALMKLKARLELSMAQHRSLTGHDWMARRIASLIPFYEYDEEHFFRSDSPPEEIAARRRAGFMRLSKHFHERFAKTDQLTAEIKKSISDLQFTEAYRAPFQFRRLVREHLDAGTFFVSSSGVTLTDLDGNCFYDLTGSYGVNVFGCDFYKECIERGSQRVRELGPVLGGYHPAIAYNVKRLREISGQDEVSFHMSGTEAVMQAVRLARYHTRRSHLVRFCGAYHGWWGDVQPGVGNPTPAHETYTLKELSDDTLRVLGSRRDIACVLVNPLQAMHPNAAPPSSSSQVDSTRSAHFDKEAYTVWLKRLRAVCTERKIVLIFDEVFSGFRLALGGAQEYFGVRADIVLYGKTVGGGLPIGVVCGRNDLMKRYRDDRPVDICFARGTFNSHPYVMGAMHEFLERVDSPEIRELYRNVESVWNDRTERLNQRLRDEGLPLLIANVSSVWSVFFTQPSRYNWMLQYYLRAEGLALSWIGTGRIIFSLNYTDADFEAVANRYVAAGKAMQQDGWWWSNPLTTNKSIKRRIQREMIAHCFMRNHHRSDARPICKPAGEARWHIVQIQPYGDKTPIVAINNTMIYYNLAQRIGTDRPFLGVQLFDPDNPRPLPRREMPEIVADYVRLIREARPHGPYILFGFCVAGVIAYMAAQQLRQAGESVPLVVIADTWVPGYSKRLPFIRRYLFRWSYRLHSLKHKCGLVLSGKQSVAEFLLSFNLVQQSRIMDLAAALHLISRAKLGKEDEDNDWFLPNLEEACFRYQASASVGDVVMFQSDHVMTRYADPKMGWSNLITGRLFVHRVPGWHEHMFQDEGASRTAEHLRSLLDQVDAERAQMVRSEASPV